MSPITTPRPHYPALDGLRGLAILLVVVYHNFGFINYFFFGWLGVDLFFVLSGFLITGILMDSVNKAHYLRNFYMRRVLRIFPLYYLCLIIFLLVLPRFADNKQLFSYYTENQGWLWAYLQNWLYIFKPAGNTDILHHFWSLAVEEQFYLVWPLTVLLIRRPGYLLGLLIMVLTGVIVLRYIVWVNKIESLAYFNLYTFSRIDGICIGSMLALLHRINFRFIQQYLSVIVLSLAGLNFLFYFFNRYYHFSFPYLAIVGYTTFAALFALLVHEAVGGHNKLVNLIFNNAFMRFFGKISYGLYVYHWPVYVLFGASLTAWIAIHHPGWPAKLIASSVLTTAAILISLVSYHFFEKWFIRQKKSFE